MDTNQIFRQFFNYGGQSQSQGDGGFVFQF